MSTSWNYRIIHYSHPTGGFGLHEVHYEDGKPVGYTAEPCGFVSFQEDGSEEIASSLAMASRGCGEPVLEQSDLDKGVCRCDGSGRIIIPCPDGMIGCCVCHYKVCPACKKE